jgi:hypothetical protein
MIGQAIGPYEIAREIGRGGMGVVYLARDTKLDRDVAIKVLPDDVADDPERLARFEREAKLLASLRHANVAAVYGLEVVDGKRCLVLEYVDGEDLADRLQRGPLPMDEALQLAREIAEGVEAAHAEGIVHRDLKPGNIKITEGGDVKVLDFGLAKALSDQPTSMLSDPANSPTVITGAYSPTMPGVILGTAGYMSPEQARGRSVDRRSDIWSFGCILFEMLSGARIFPGETVTDSLGAILHKDPEWRMLPPETPATVRLLLRRCLAKDRRRRQQDIGDVRIELDEAIADPTGSSLGLGGAAAGSRGSLARAVPWVLTALLAAALVAGWFVTRPDAVRPLAGRQPVRLRGSGHALHQPLHPPARPARGPAPAEHGRRFAAVLLARRALGRLRQRRQADADLDAGRPPHHPVRRQELPRRRLEPRRDDHLRAGNPGAAVSRARRRRHARAADEGRSR